MRNIPSKIFVTFADKIKASLLMLVFLLVLLSTLACFNVACASPAESLAAIFVVSEPSGAEVRIDGKMVGHTNLRADVAGGYHAINIKKEGYVSYTGIVLVPSGGQIEVSESLTRLDKSFLGKSVAHLFLLFIVVLFAFLFLQLIEDIRSKNVPWR